MLETAYSGDRGDHSQFFGLLRSIDKKGALGEALTREALKYTIFDLQRISAGLAREVNLLPSPYRERIAPYFIEQFFKRYYRLTEMSEAGAFKRMGDDIIERSLYRDYCEAAEKTLLDPRRDSFMREYDPQHGLFYFIVNCFAMFVLEEPGHPVGMPFPGGFTVEKRDGVYYCPIREKEKDIPSSICNFCPCKQADI